MSQYQNVIDKPTLMAAKQSSMRQSLNSNHFFDKKNTCRVCLKKSPEIRLFTMTTLNCIVMYQLFSIEIPDDNWMICVHCNKFLRKIVEFRKTALSSHNFIGATPKLSTVSLVEDEESGPEEAADFDTNSNKQKNTVSEINIPPLLKPRQPEGEMNQLNHAIAIEKSPCVSYKCDFCTENFQLTQELRSHVMNFHQEQMKNHVFAPKKVNDIWICCGLPFKHWNSVQNHKFRVHPEKLRRRPRKCLWCRERVEDKTALEKHMKEVHPFERSRLTKKVKRFAIDQASETESVND